MIKRFQKSDHFFSKVTSRKNWRFDTVEGEENDLSIREGKKIQGIFFPSESLYNTYNEELNPDGTYKRVIYYSEKNNFFNNSPAIIYSKEFNQNTRLNLHDRFNSLSLSKNTWGKR